MRPRRISPYLTSGTVTELSAMLVDRMTCRQQEAEAAVLTMRGKRGKLNTQVQN